MIPTPPCRGSFAEKVKKLWDNFYTRPFSAVNGLVYTSCEGFIKSFPQFFLLFRQDDHDDINIYNIIPVELKIKSDSNITGPKDAPYELVKNKN